MRSIKYVSMSVLFIALTAVSLAQDTGDPLQVYEPATENVFLPGARAAAMGGAQIAAGSDGSALWYNPALLTRIRSAEISGTLTHQRFTNKTDFIGIAVPEANLNNTSLGGLWAMFPVPTERGGLTLGLSVNRVRNFDRIFRYATGPAWSANPLAVTGYGGGEDENGSLWAWSFGGAIEISPRSSVGLSLEIYDGHDEFASFFDSTNVANDYRLQFSHNINDDYTGVSGKAGVSYNAANWLNIGLLVGFPTSLSIDQTSDDFQRDNFDSFEDHFSASYRYTLPFWFGAGAEVSLRELTLATDINYRDYTQLKYWRGLPDLSEADRLVKRWYNDDVSYHLGAEYYVRPADLRLRAGYFRQPIPFKGFPVTEQPRFFTLGAGLLIDRTVNVDLAFLTGSWERKDPSLGTVEKYDVQRFLVTFSYRIR